MSRLPTCVAVEGAVGLRVGEERQDRSAGSLSWLVRPQARVGAGFGRFGVKDGPGCGQEKRAVETETRSK